MNCSRPSVRRASERGSALLIVLVFSAIVLILLYREMPIATFEAQRDKEQLAVDRGHEYQRAVQLFYRRFRGQYPASLDQLMNTNGMRFLRRKYKDPLTGKDDWRLLHAGPGGTLTDSKVTTAPATSQLKGNDTSHDTGSTTELNSLDGEAGPNLHRSKPAIAANASPVAGAAAVDGATPTAAQLDADPSKPLLPTSASPASGNNAAAPGNSVPPGSATPNGKGASATGQDAMNAVTNTNLGSNGSLAGGQAIAGAGGIAGVASVAKGHSIKKINDQTDYSKWEFYYDPSKDTGRGGSAAGGTGANNNQPQQPGIGLNSQPTASTTPQNGPDPVQQPNQVQPQPPSVVTPVPDSDTQ